MGGGGQASRTVLWDLNLILKGSDLRTWNKVEM